MNSIDEKKVNSEKNKVTKNKSSTKILDEINKNGKLKEVNETKEDTTSKLAKSGTTKSVKREENTKKKTTTTRKIDDSKNKTSSKKANNNKEDIDKDIKTKTKKNSSTKKEGISNTNKRDTNATKKKIASNSKEEKISNVNKEKESEETKLKETESNVNKKTTNKSKNVKIKEEVNKTKKETEKAVSEKKSKKIEESEGIKTNPKKVKIDSNKSNKNSKNEEKQNDNKVQLQEKIEIIKDIKKIGQVLKEERKRKLPEDVQKKIVSKTITNIIVGSIITLYLIFIILGFKNIEKEIFITDLKVFSVSILVISIILFENSYKRENKSLAIFGIEILILAIINIALMYVDIMNNELFMITTLTITMAFILYYIIKSIIIFVKMRKSYYKQNSELSEIIEEEV